MNRDEKSLYFRSLSSVFSACAGVIPLYDMYMQGATRVLRMCGGDPCTIPG